MMNDNKPINKENLAAVVDKLKRVLNPAVTQDQYSGYGIRLITDIPFNNTDVISFSVKSLSTDTSEGKTIYCIGYRDSQNHYCASNLGSALITQIGGFIQDNKIILLLIPDLDNASNLLKTEAEVLVVEDNKNHVTSIEYITEEEYDYYTDQNYLTDVEGDLDVNFYYSVRTGETSYKPILNGGRGNIESIYHSTNSDKLNHSITLIVEGKDGDENTVITGQVDISTERDTENTLNLTVDTDAIVEAVKDDFTLDPATTEDLGGIRLADPQSLLSNLFPVQLNQNTSAAYVDLTDFNPDVTSDIHRFAKMPADASVAGTYLVQYIGTTTGDYTFGYYYQWAPTEFNVVSESDGWGEIRDGGQGVAGNKIAEYNKNHDYILKVNTPIVITLIDTLTDLDPIQDETLFNITQGDTFSEDLTYGDIKTKIGFELSSGFITYDSTKDYDLTLSLTTSASAWKQKNVLPMVKVGSPLVFQGTVTAATGETDTEALERQVSDPEIGDFYIVLPSKQEYYWTGSEWEFMGLVVTVPEYTGSGHISVNNYVISDSGLQETLTEGNNIDITNNTISALGYAWDGTLKSFAEGESVAIGTKSHSEGSEILYSSISYTFSWGTNSRNITCSNATIYGLIVGDIIFYNNLYRKVNRINGNVITVDSSFGNAATNVTLLRVSGIAYSSNSHVEGNYTNASGYGAHSEGSYTKANGGCSHAEGELSEAIGTNSHAEGRSTLADGFAGHAEGCETKTYGSNSVGTRPCAAHAEGYGTIAQNTGEHALGCYNISRQNSTTGITFNTPNGDSKNTIHSIGIGYTRSNVDYRKNALEVMENGDMYLYGVGNYVGTDIKLPNNNVKTLQESLGDKNTIETVKVNGTALTPDTNKAVNITIPTVNDATYSIKTDISGTETTVSDFTANQSTADSITFVQGNNVTLTPDAANGKITIAATDTTYSDFAGSTHGLVPSASSGDAGKFLKADGSWDTPASGGTVTSITAGNGLKTSDGNAITSTGTILLDEDVNTTAIASPENFSGKKYNGVFSVDTSQTIAVTGNANPKFREVIYLIYNEDDTSSITVAISPSSGVSAINMSGSSTGITIPAEKYCEIVLTCWSSTLVTYNFGISA